MAMKKCFSCGEIANTKYLRKFKSTGSVRYVNSCYACTYLSDEEFENKVKNKKRNK